MASELSSQGNEGAMSQPTSELYSQVQWDALVWCFSLGIFLMRYMTIGVKVNKKFRNVSVLITEQVFTPQFFVYKFTVYCRTCTRLLIWFYDKKPPTTYALATKAPIALAPT